MYVKFKNKNKNNNKTINLYYLINSKKSKKFKFLKDVIKKLIDAIINLPSSS